MSLCELLKFQGEIDGVEVVNNNSSVPHRDPDRGVHVGPTDENAAVPVTGLAGDVLARTAGIAVPQDQASQVVWHRHCRRSHSPCSHTRVCHHHHRPVPTRRTRCRTGPCSSMPHPRRLPLRAWLEFTTRRPGDSRTLRHLLLLANTTGLWRQIHAVCVVRSTWSFVGYALW